MFGTTSIKYDCQVLYKNSLVNNIYEACTCCYDNTKPINYLEKKEYIEKRINAGHESILEHGRLAIIFYNIPHSHSNSIIEIMGLEYSKWLEFYTVQLENNNYNLIINGSIRAYKHFLNNLEPDVYDRNYVVFYMCKMLRENTVKELYGTSKYINFDDFIDIEPDVEDIESTETGIDYDIKMHKLVDGITTDNEQPKSLILGADELNTYDPFDIEGDIQQTILTAGFEETVLLHILPITIVFNNMSRTCTHQLVRHRNAITQESQRYVDYKDSSFTIPIPYYDKENEKEYNIEIFDKKVNTSLSTLANALIKIYNQLIKQGLKKEEARAFLPSNVNCKRLYMTYSLFTLIAFLKLRTDSHAQYEIRMYAETALELIDCIPDYKALIEKYK